MPLPPLLPPQLLCVPTMPTIISPPDISHEHTHAHTTVHLLASCADTTSGLQPLSAIFTNAILCCGNPELSPNELVTCSRIALASCEALLSTCGRFFKRSRAPLLLGMQALATTLACSPTETLANILGACIR